MSSKDGRDAFNIREYEYIIVHFLVIKIEMYDYERIRNSGMLPCPVSRIGNFMSVWNTWEIFPFEDAQVVIVNN